MTKKLAPKDLPALDLDALVVAGQANAPHDLPDQTPHDLYGMDNLPTGDTSNNGYTPNNDYNPTNNDSRRTTPIRRTTTSRRRTKTRG